MKVFSKVLLLSLVSLANVSLLHADQPIDDTSIIDLTELANYWKKELGKQKTCADKLESLGYIFETQEDILKLLESKLDAMKIELEDWVILESPTEQIPLEDVQRGWKKSLEIRKESLDAVTNCERKLKILGGMVNIQNHIINVAEDRYGPLKKFLAE